MKIFSTSTRLTTIFLFIFCLFNISLTTEKVSAKPNKCEQIRQVRRLALQESLDGQNLATLEARFCRNGLEKPESNLSLNNASEGCLNLAIMKRFAQMTTSNRDFVHTIKSLQTLSCQASQEQSSFDWANRKPAKRGAHWYYPNGNKAKWGAHWFYPNGNKAQWSSTWYYPNGNKAKLGSAWYYPNGESVTTRFNQNKGFWYELEILESFWKAK